MAPRSPFKPPYPRSPTLLALVLALLSMAVPAQDDSDPRFVADIELQTVDELHETLSRAEQLLVEGVAVQDGDAAVTFVLHGPVIRGLLRDNYLANKRMVDLAASLSALGVISIKACRTWMSSHRVDERQLQPFVETVSFGPGEVQRLVKEENYLYF